MSTRPIGTRGLALRVARQGAAAGEAGTPGTACPYGADRPFSRRAWHYGHALGAKRTGEPRPSDVVDPEANPTP